MAGYTPAAQRSDGTAAGPTECYIGVLGDVVNDSGVRLDS